MNRVITILCHRDGLTEEEAKHIVDIARDEIEAVGFNYEACEEIMMNILGLEMDYITDLF